MNIEDIKKYNCHYNAPVQWNRLYQGTLTSAWGSAYITKGTWVYIPPDPRVN